MTTPRLKTMLPGHVLGALLVGAMAGCSTSPCDELADASEEGGCATRARGAPAIACEGEAEIDASCWLDHVRDVCSPSGAELLAVADCVAR